jgi:hypothetical protein
MENVKRNEGEEVGSWVMKSLGCDINGVYL